MLIEPKIAGASIVLVGSFNPAIYSPDWFVRRGLVKEGEVYQNDPDLLIHPQVSQFRLEWCQLVVEPERFTISTSKDPLVLIMDLTVRTFEDFLPQTPITKIGMNRQVHFPVASEVQHRVGQILAPPQVWGDWGASIMKTTPNKRSGMTSLTMQQSVFEEERTGYISATVEPSNVLSPTLGIYVQVNDHHDVPPNSLGALAATELLRTRFESSIENSNQIINQVMKIAHDSAK